MATLCFFWTGTSSSRYKQAQNREYVKGSGQEVEEEARQEGTGWVLTGNNGHECVSVSVCVCMWSGYMHVHVMGVPRARQALCH